MNTNYLQSNYENEHADANEQLKINAPAVKSPLNQPQQQYYLQRVLKRNSNVIIIRLSKS